MAHINVHKYNDFFRHMFQNPLFWAVIGILILFGILMLAAKTGSSGHVEPYPYYHPYFGL